MTHELDRRTFLTAASVLGAGAVLASCTGSEDTKASSSSSDDAGSSKAESSSVSSKADTASTTFKSSPFTLGVASGDPLPDAVVIWTRLALDPIDVSKTPAAEVEVTWEVAADERFGKIQQSGSVIASPEDAHSVHVDVKKLKPATEIFYRFKVGTWTSTVGRAKTAPAKDATPGEVRFGFTSCQDYQIGAYLAHRAMAADKLDAVVWLGDYIYEYAPDEKAVRPLSTSAPADLDGYRNRYGNYKTDVDLQGCHASAPWISIWDDHETQDNYAGLVSENKDTSSEEFTTRRTAAYKAWWEHMPVRMPKPTGPDLEIYRRLDFGTLMKMVLLDTRQYRDNQACGASPLDVAVRCEGVDTDSLLGPTELAWVLDELQSADEVTWCVLAQQIMMGQLQLAEKDPVLNVDQWDGYRAERQKLLDVMKPNTVVLSGDIHSSWVNDLKIDFDDPSSKTVATEFVGPPTSSVFPAGFAAILGNAKAINPHVRYVDSTSHGYGRCTVTAAKWTTEYRYGDIKDPQGQVTTAKTWTVTPDTPGAIDV